MFILILFFIIFILLSLMMIFMNLVLFKKMMKNREKMSLFECGFDSISSTRIPFSVQFFLISLMFLIFDIEISLLIPFIYIIKFFNLIMLISLFIFLLILILSLYIEYSENMLEWKIK